MNEETIIFLRSLAIFLFLFSLNLLFRVESVKASQQIKSYFSTVKSDILEIKSADYSFLKLKRNCDYQNCFKQLQAAKRY